jgi:hypothetical protein
MPGACKTRACCAHAAFPAIYACHARGVHTAFMPRIRGMYSRLTCGLHAACMCGVYAASTRRPCGVHAGGVHALGSSRKYPHGRRALRDAGACMPRACDVHAACLPRVHVGVCVCARVCQSLSLCARVGLSGCVLSCACVCEIVSMSTLHAVGCMLHRVGCMMHRVGCMLHAVKRTPSCWCARAGCGQHPCSGRPPVLRAFTHDPAVRIGAPGLATSAPGLAHVRTGTRPHPHRD